MLRRGLSVHRDDCPVVGRPEVRFWKGPYPSASVALADVADVAATILPFECAGDCSAETIDELLALGWDWGGTTPDEPDGR